jgi:zinc resistance-associated protein
MKKTMLALALIATVALAGYGQAEARSCGGPGQMKGHGPAMQMDEETAKAHEQFLTETRELRKQMHTKKTELRAVMANEKPDEKKAAKLSEELFDLRENMRAKAKESGLPAWGLQGALCDGPRAGGRGMMGRGAGDCLPQGRGRI